MTNPNGETVQWSTNARSEPELQAPRLLSKQTERSLAEWNSLSMAEQKARLKANQYGFDQTGFDAEAHIEAEWNRGKLIRDITGSLYRRGLKPSIPAVVQILRNRGYEIPQPKPGNNGFANVCKPNDSNPPDQD